MKKFIVFIFAVISLCSCGDEYKANRFIKQLDGDKEYLTRYVGDDAAYVFYKRGDSYYRYDVRTEETKYLFQIKKGEHIYICDNFDLGKADVFYTSLQGDVYRRDLMSGETVCINSDGNKRNLYIGTWQGHLLFYDESEDIDCDSRIIDYNAVTMESSFVKFDSIDDEYKRFYVPMPVVGHWGILVPLYPYMIEDGMELPSYLYHYYYENVKTLRFTQLCKSYDIKFVENEDKTIIVVEKDYDTSVIYDMYGRAIKEFPSISAWPEHRGLSSGNMIARSSTHNILCYIANDDDPLVSSVDLYYYDGNIGEEVKIKSFVNAKGEKVTFTMGENARRDIRVAANGEGLTFYGGTDFLNEYSLFFFDFATREVHLIDRGTYVSYTNDRFKVTHHNGSVTWYNSNGEKSQPRRKSYWEREGELWGEMINSYF